MDLENLLPESFKQDEKEYWQMREKLLQEYRGKWIAFHEKEILSFGNNLYQVTLEAFQKSKEGAFITKVGEEDKIITKIRLRKEFDYDMEYEPFPLPQARVKFYNFEKTMSETYERVIPDTGADTTCLPTKDCQSLRLFLAPGIRVRSRSFGGPYRVSILLPGFAEISERQYLCYIEPSEETERLLGRDVLNQITITFKGQEGKLVFKE